MNSLIYLIFITIFIAKNGYSQFSPRSIVDTNGTGISEIITSDLNNDNLPDILVSQKYAQHNKISYYLNQGNGQYGIQQVVDTNIYFPLSVASADFDGNGWNDIVTFSGMLNSGDLFIYMNNSGVFSSQVKIDSNLYNSQSVKIEDLDNDNDADIVLIIDTALIVYYNNGVGSFSKTVVPKAGISTEYYAIEINDIDDDGFSDIIIGGVKTIIYKNSNGVISFDSTRTAIIPDNNHLVFLVHLNDFDNDGDLDLVVNKDGANLIKWYTNDGLGIFSSPQTIDSNVSQCFSITSADFDNDGDFDLFTAIPQLGKVVWYQNNGSGNFGLPLLVYQGSISQTNEVCSDDLNNDGLSDIIWSEELSIHLNNSNGLGLANYELENAISIYPNPTTDVLTIDGLTEKGQLLVFNNLGQTVLSSYNLVPGTNVLSLALAPGAYVMIIESGTNAIHKKVIVR